MHTELINKLGGTGAIAEYLGIPQNRVGNWLLRGIPWHRRFAVAEMAKAKRVKLPEGFLGGDSARAA